MTGRTVFTEFWQLFSCRAEYSIISNHCADSGSYYLIERPTHVFEAIAMALCACKFDSIANKFEEKKMAKQMERKSSLTRMCDDHPNKTIKYLAITQTT